MLTDACALCGEPVSPEIQARAHGENVFCCTKHRVDFHNAKDRAKRKAVWEAAPMIKCAECGIVFKPEFQSGWRKRKRCVACRLTPAEHNRRRRAQPPSDRPKHTKRPWHVGQGIGKQWKCRGCGKMSNNRLDCPECKAKILAREDSWLDDYSVQTIDLANMGLIPY